VGSRLSEISGRGANDHDGRVPVVRDLVSEFLGTGTHE
jgi:hypothetical protein